MAADMASIEVQREFGGWTDHLRSYEVVIDREVVGHLRPGECHVCEVAPGSHELFLKIDWGRSETVDVRLTAGQTATFRCAPRANILTGLYWATLGRRRYIKLTRTTD